MKKNGSGNGHAAVTDEPITSVEEVTPELAERYLASRPPDQRPMSRANVDSLARDMAGGKWRVTHQGVAFDRAGRLVDGQHRMAAVAQSGVTVRMMVTRGTDYGYAAPIDQGYQRRVAHVLGLPHNVVSLVNALRRLQSADFHMRKITAAEVEESYAANQAVVDAVKAIANAKLYVPATVAAAVCYAWPIAPDKCSSFLIQVRDGELLERGNPAYALRRWLQGLGGAGKSRAGAASALLATCNAVRHELVGQKLTNITTGVTGYRAITAKRRAMRLPNTPSTDLVKSGSGFAPSAKKGAPKGEKTVATQPAAPFPSDDPLLGDWGDAQ